MEIISQISAIITNLISSLGYPGIFLLMSLESALIPFPSELTMPFAGFLVAKGQFNFYLVALTGAFGNLAGALTLYYLSKYIGEDITRNVIKKYGKYILINERKLDNSLQLFQKYGLWFITISRLIPAVRAVISIPAGLSKINPWKFAMFTLLGSILWSTALTYLGFLLGENWDAISPVTKKFDIIILLITIIVVTTYIYHHTRKPHIKKIDD